MNESGRLGVLRLATEATPFWRVGERPRVLEPEVMDDPAIDEALHTNALGALATINRVSLTIPQIVPPIAALAARVGRPLRILDVATGAGDIPIGIARWSRARGIDCEVAGCDVSARAVRYARQRSLKEGTPIRFFQSDVISDPPEGWDVVTCCLFLHHLQVGEVETLLCNLKGSAQLLVVSDLLRSALGLGAAIAGTRLLTRSPVARLDGPRSVRAAFTLAEMRDVCRRAELHEARLRPIFPFRFRLTWSRP
jgi:2-polyprenyl-3-methyl-5-hydroxy-6-metoxy-1,4-benzoquinol methylase